MTTAKEKFREKLWWLNDRLEEIKREVEEFNNELKKMREEIVKLEKGGL